MNAGEMRRRAAAFAVEERAALDALAVGRDRPVPSEPDLLLRYPVGVMARVFRAEGGGIGWDVWLYVRDPEMVASPFKAIGVRPSDPPEGWRAEKYVNRLTRWGAHRAARRLVARHVAAELHRRPPRFEEFGA